MSCYVCVVAVIVVVVVVVFFLSLTQQFVCWKSLWIKRNVWFSFKVF